MIRVVGAGREQPGLSPAIGAGSERRHVEKAPGIVRIPGACDDPSRYGWRPLLSDAVDGEGPLRPRLVGPDLADALKHLDRVALLL